MATTRSDDAQQDRDDPAHSWKLPTPPTVQGTLGAPFVVLTLSELRHAERLEQSQLFQTADGDLRAYPGDVAITAYGGERYPIQADDFYGNYEVVGAVGNRLVARRLIHPRVAWPVTSSTVAHDYGSARGTVTIGRDGWLCQSDDAALAAINSDVALKGHVVVGPARDLGTTPWARRFSASALLLAFLPSLLALLALSAFASATATAAWARGLTNGLVALETVLLVAGGLLAWWIRRDRWYLKAAVSSSFELARDFQDAVELLGDRRSTHFPAIALWRAAQRPTDKGLRTVIAELGGRADQCLTRLKQHLGDTRDALRSEFEHYQRAEHVATVGALVSLGAILCANLYLLFVEEQRLLELFSIWLPSLIGAFHAFNLRRQVGARLSAIRSFSAQLKFVNDRLYAIAPGSIEQLQHAPEDLEATLKLLCEAIARNVQGRIEFAIAEMPGLPV